MKSKKLVIVILGIILLFGGIIAYLVFSDYFNKNINYESYVKEGNVYRETKKSNVVLDGKKHELAYVYSSMVSEDENYSGYMTVLFDGKNLNNELTDITICGLVGDKTCETAKPTITEKVIDNKLVLIITSGMYEFGNYAGVFIIDSDGKVLKYSSGNYNFGVHYTSNDQNILTYDEELKTEYVKLDGNIITVYTCEEMYEYMIDGSQVEKKVMSYPDNAYISGGC